MKYVINTENLRKEMQICVPFVLLHLYVTVNNAYGDSVTGNRECRFLQKVPNIFVQIYQMRIFFADFHKSP